MNYQLKVTVEVSRDGKYDLGGRFYARTVIIDDNTGTRDKSYSLKAGRHTLAYCFDRLKEEIPSGIFAKTHLHIIDAEICEGVERLGKVFEKQDRMASVSLPSTINYIDPYAFEGTQIKELVFPENTICLPRILGMKFNIPSGVQIINWDAYGTGSIDHLSLPKGLRKFNCEVNISGGMKYAPLLPFAPLPDTIEEWDGHNYEVI